MLKRVENVELYYQRDPWGLLTGRRYHVLIQIGRKEHVMPGRIHVNEFKALRERSEREPVCFGRIGERSYWRFADRWFWDNDNLPAESVHALIVTRDQRRGDTVTRAQSVAAMAIRPTPTAREAIPSDVKQALHR